MRIGAASEGIAGGDDHDHRAGIECDADEAGSVRRLEEEPDVRAVQLHVGLLQAEDVKERTPSRVRQTRLEADRDPPLCRLVIVATLTVRRRGAGKRPRPSAAMGGGLVARIEPIPMDQAHGKARAMLDELVQRGGEPGH